MKTKIIYISGNEVFDMADIRVAFEEVRRTLGLGRDTIMFGVPVDNDDALANGANATETDDCTVSSAMVADDNIYNDDNDIVPEINNNDTVVANIDNPQIEQQNTPDDEITDIVDTDDNSDMVAQVIDINELATMASDKTADTITDQVADTEIPEPEMATPDTEISKTEGDDAPADQVIPILSVLAGKKAEVPQPQVDDTVVDDVPEMDVDVIESEQVVTEMPSDDDVISDNTDEIKESLDDDVIDTDAPVAPMEKTLEQLLESMTPLREDVIEEHQAQDTTQDNPADIEEIMVADTLDTDATLEKLAAEFAENRDKIQSAPKGEGHSKIGKLKNILPFKKAKRDDTGLMGDLFGWAGVAANDDDFAMPGFFTGTTKK